MMKQFIAIITAVVVILTAASCNSSKQTAVSETASLVTTYLLNSASDSASYAIGINYGSGLKENMKSFPGGEYNLDALAEGFIRAIKDDTAALVMDPATSQEYIQAFVQAAVTKDAEAEKARGDEFLAENKNRDGVVTTESGLQFKVLTQGEGEIPTAENQVTVHYTGKLLDGTVFDSSIQRGEPATFGVTQVIPGWTEILQRMPVGSKYQVWIPSELAYGQQGQGPIKPNSVLEFEIELLEIPK